MLIGDHHSVKSGDRKTAATPGEASAVERRFLL